MSVRYDHAFFTQEERAQVDQLEQSTPHYLRIPHFAYITLDGEFSLEELRHLVVQLTALEQRKQFCACGASLAIETHHLTKEYGDEDAEDIYGS